MSSDDIYLILFSIQQKTKRNRCYFNKLRPVIVTFPNPSLWFPSKLRNLLLAKYQPFFFSHPRANFWLAWNSCQFLHVTSSQETCSHWGPGSIPPRVLNALTFSHTAFARLHTEVQLRQESSLYHQWARRGANVSERLVNIFEESMAQWKILLCYQVNEKEHFWNIRKPKVPLFTCSLKANHLPLCLVYDLLRTQTNKKRNRKVLTDECQQLFYFLCVSKNSLFYWKPHTTTTPGYAPFYSGIFWINFLLYNLSNQDSRCSHHKGPFQSCLLVQNTSRNVTDTLTIELKPEDVWGHSKFLNGMWIH